MKNFAITGVAGYIAPRHLQAIKDTGNTLVAACDPHDSVGILDKYFPKTAFFTEIERFDRHIEMLRRRSNGKKIDYVSICSPNHLHDAHIRLALRSEANAICEKPLVLNPWNLDALEEIERETQKKIYTILQLRIHPALIALKKKISDLGMDNDHNSGCSSTNQRIKKDVILTYITSRGPWYHYSWKGDLTKSGGVATNIGIHFFDLLIWLFGKVVYSEVHLSELTKMSGFLELELANVKWFLSIDKEDLPEEIKLKNVSTFRTITIDGEDIEFTNGFTDLHTRVYEKIIKDEGFRIEEARPAIEAVYKIRNSKPVDKRQLIHPYAK